MDKRPVVISMMVQDILSTEVPIKGTAETTVSTKIPVVSKFFKEMFWFFYKMLRKVKRTKIEIITSFLLQAKEPILLLPRILPPKNRRWIRTAAYVICCVKMPSIPKYFTYSPAIRPEQHFFLYWYLDSLYYSVLNQK